jgi:hypothetical protein
MATLDKVGLDIAVVLGSTRMPVHQALPLGRGAIIELDAFPGRRGPDSGEQPAGRARRRRDQWQPNRGGNTRDAAPRPQPALNRFAAANPCSGGVDLLHAASPALR